MGRSRCALLWCGAELVGMDAELVGIDDVSGSDEPRPAIGSASTANPCAIRNAIVQAACGRL
jgi:hypothetical protein